MMEFSFQLFSKIERLENQYRDIEIYKFSLLAWYRKFYTCLLLVCFLLHMCLKKVPDPTFICGHYNFVLKRKNHIQGHVAS